MRLVLACLLGLGLAGLTYGWLERLGRRAWLAFACRAVAWSALGLLVLNLTCPVRDQPGERPLVLLDASLSLGAAGGRWSEARDSALRWGDVRPFGDERARSDSIPAAGRTLLAPALEAALATGRQVLIVSDGEIEDAPELPAGSLSQAGVRLFPRRAVGDLAVTRFDAPLRVTARDSLRLTAEVRSFAAPGRDSARLEISAEGKSLARRAVRLGAGGLVRLGFTLSTTGLSPGDHLLRAALVSPGDSEPRDDARLALVSVSATPGVVVLASPADWDARFLYRAIKDVAQLPVRGYTRLEPGRWRTMEDLKPISADEVRQAVRRADLLVLKGAAPELLREARARGRWLWPSGEGGETLVPGDWYLSAGLGSPVAGAFVGLPVDSFPPAFQVTPIEPQRGDWVALTAQEGRRGAERPVMIGRDSLGVRRVLMAADGLYRWGFRGGSSEQAYRALVAATTSWLLGGNDATRGPARSLRPVVPRGRPVVFEWIAPPPAVSVPIGLDGPGGALKDTLRFDGAGRAALWLSPGGYRYRLENGVTGSVAVEEYSDEWLQRSVGLAEHSAAARGPRQLTSSRQWLWLFAVAVAALAGEWWARRRLGLR